MLTQQRVKELFNYNQNTGELIRKIGRLKGEPAGAIKEAEQGRIIVYIDGAFYKAHRVIWLYMTGDWPPELMDHIDGDAGNNK